MTSEIVKMDLPSNSYKSKEAIKEPEDGKPKVDKVVRTPVKRKKKNLGKKFSEIFVEDDVQSVGSYLINDVLIPAAKDTIVDFISSGIEMLMFGRGSGSSRKKTNGYNGGNRYTPYNSISNDDNRSNNRYKSYSKSQSRYILDDIIVDSRGEAFDIINELSDLIQQYGVASVSDLNDMIGETGEFIDNKWGWYDVGSAKIIRVREGYLVDLPKVRYLD